MMSAALDELRSLKVALAEGLISQEEHDVTRRKVLSTGKETVSSPTLGTVSQANLVQVGNSNHQQQINLIDETDFGGASAPSANSAAGITAGKALVVTKSHLLSKAEKAARLELSPRQTLLKMPFANARIHKVVCNNQVVRELHVRTFLSEDAATTHAIAAHSG